MGRFATVRPASDATTVRRKESASLNSLYEVKELFNVGDVDDTENEDPTIVQSSPLINTASNSYWLAVSVNGDVSIFTVTSDCGYETNISVKGDVCGLAWLGDSSLLSIFTTERCFTMISMKFGKLLEINMHDQAIAQCSSAKISTTEIGDQCFVCIIDDTGVTNTVVFSNWKNFMSCNETEHSKNGLQKVLNSITYNCSQAKNLMTDMLASKALSAIIALPEKGDYFITSSFTSTSSGGQIDNTFLHDIKLNAPIVRIREVCGGRFLVGVTSSGQMVIHDLWSFCHLTYAKPIDLKIGKNTRVVDFIFIDQDKEEFSYKNVVLVVQKDDALSLEVVSLPGGDVSYALDIEQGTTLLYAAAESNQRVMIVIEPLQDGHGVTLKEIAEAEPEQKLTRLIEQNRLDEAEKFAIEYGLDCQRVHVSRMDILYDETTTNASPEVFTKFMASMDKVKDDNRVAETCFSGATTLQNFSRIQALLQYVEKRNVTDKYCARKLASVAYTFGTYRIVTKPDDASFDHWPTFVEGIDGPGEWMGIFDSFLQGGFIAEARVIFNRHTKYVIEGISLDITVSTNEGGCAFIESVKNTLMNNISLWSDLISFIEYDVVPKIIQSSDIEVKLYIFMVDFLLFLAKRLEKFDPSNFPQNAYHVTTTMERIFRTLAGQSITPTKQALLGIIGRKYFSAQSRSHELVVYSENLAAIQRLKEVYHCALSYDNYITLDAERICYHILQSAVEILPFQDTTLSLQYPIR